MIKKFTKKTNALLSDYKNACRQPDTDISRNKGLIHLLNSIIFIIISAILFVAPFLKGLFYENNYLPTIAAILIIFLLFVVFRIFSKKSFFLHSPIFIVSLGFPLLYFIVSLWAIGPRYAQLEWLKYCMFFAIFYLISELTVKYNRQIFLLWVIVLSALGVSLFGIDAAAGSRITSVINHIFNSFGFSNNVINIMFSGNRISSTFQYVNALAIFLVIASILCYTLQILHQNNLIKSGIGSLNFILTVTLLLTISRGGLAVYFITLFVLILIIPKSVKVKIMFNAIVINSLSIVIAVNLSKYIGVDTPVTQKIWTLIGIGSILTFVGSIFVYIAEKLIEKINWIIYAVAFTIIAVICTLTLLNILKSTSEVIIANPKEVSESVKSLSRTILLQNDKSYVLKVKVDAFQLEDKPNAYIIRIDSKNINDIQFTGNPLQKTETIETYEGHSTQGIEEIAIPFLVPKDNNIISISFINQQSQSKAKIFKASIIDAENGDIVKEVILKNKYVPEYIIDRFVNVQISNSTLQRTEYYKDAFKIFKENWLKGTGGGAWPLLYHRYQDYFYQSLQTHSYFWQIAVELGIWGVFLFLSLLLAIIVSVFLILKRKEENLTNKKIVVSGVSISALALVTHSVIDFDLSFPALFMILWVLVGLINSIYRSLSIGKNLGNFDGKSANESIVNSNHMKSKHLIYIVSNAMIGSVLLLVLTVVSVYFTISILIGDVYYSKGQKSLEKANISEALSQLKKADFFDTLNPVIKLDYANLIIYSGDHTEEVLVKANELIDEAYDLSYNNYYFNKESVISPILPLIAQYYFNTGNIYKGLSVIERSISINPLQQEEWMFKANTFNEIVYYYLKNSNVNSAMQYINKTLEILNEVRKVNIANKNPFILNSETMEAIERIQFLRDGITEQRGNINSFKVTFYGMPQMDVNGDAIPDQWNLSKMESTKISNDNGNMIIEGNSEKSYSIKSRNLNLKPSTKYKIEMYVSEPEELKTIKFEVYGLPRVLKMIKEQNQVFRGEFETSKDFVPSTNMLYLYFKGKIIINKLVITEE